MCEEQIPDEVMNEWLKQCDCCDLCGDVPCERVMAGGPCERNCNCTCDDDEDYIWYE